MKHVDFAQIRKKYTDLVTKERVAKRCIFLNEVAEVFAERVTSGLQLRMSAPRLMSATYSYFYDIERYKDFHQIDKANFIKVATYTVKWLLRYKPLVVEGIPNTSQEYSLSVAANEAYALLVASVITDVAFSPDLATRLVYEFHFHDYSTGMMNITLERLKGLHV